MGWTGYRKGARLMLTGSPGQDRERLRNGVSRQLSGSASPTHSINQSQPSLTTSKTCSRFCTYGEINPPILSCPVQSYRRIVAYRIVSWPSTSARLLFCLAPRLHADLGRWATMQRGDGGGGEGKCIHAQHNQECSTPSSAESCCSVSLALAQP